MLQRGYELSRIFGGSYAQLLRKPVQKLELLNELHKSRWRITPAIIVLVQIVEHRFANLKRDGRSRLNHFAVNLEQIT